MISASNRSVHLASLYALSRRVHNHILTREHERISRLGSRAMCHVIHVCRLSNGVGESLLVSQVACMNVVVP